MNNTKNKRQRVIFSLPFGFLLTLALDQWTKYLASTILRRLESFSLISGVFELRYLENRGAAFGIMQNRQIVFCGRRYYYTRCYFCICTRRCHLHHITDHCVSVLYCLHPEPWEI